MNKEQCTWTGQCGPESSDHFPIHLSLTSIRNTNPTIYRLDSLMCYWAFCSSNKWPYSKWDSQILNLVKSWNPNMVALKFRAEHNHFPLFSHYISALIPSEQCDQLHRFLQPPAEATPPYYKSVATANTCSLTGQERRRHSGLSPTCYLREFTLSPHFLRGYEK